VNTDQDQSVDRATALIDLKRYEEAAAVLAHRIAEAPQDVSAWLEMARCHLGAGEHQRALEAADEVLRLDPKQPGAFIYRSTALRGLHRMEDAEAALREAVRLAPHYHRPYALLAEVLAFRAGRLRQQPARDAADALSRQHQASVLLEEASQLAQEGIRLGPDDVAAYMSAWKVAGVDGNHTVTDQLEKEILRIDPQHPFALAQQTRKAANTPGTRAADAADLVADALTADPASPDMQRELDSATYRLLRGTRWLALLCLLFTAVGLDLAFAPEDRAPDPLPLSLGQRLWDVLLLVPVWVFGALLRYRRRRRGVRLNVRSLLRRDGWARLAVGHAAAVMVCVLVITLVPWTERDVPRVMFWVTLVASLLTMYFDRPYTRAALASLRRRT